MTRLVHITAAKNARPGQVWRRWAALGLGTSLVVVITVFVVNRGDSEAREPRGITTTELRENEVLIDKDQTIDINDEDLEDGPLKPFVDELRRGGHLETAPGG
ncbi:hypothetical protein OG589_34740 [Sphaerisporangium sp. NBC_01403]|uniref:hypothetical protein n=1 Tax=Sphaerisporangium sp. NBC_01403 TaxID=2903599 RepID=UPI003248C8AB